MFGMMLGFTVFRGGVHVWLVFTIVSTSEK